MEDLSKFIAKTWGRKTNRRTGKILRRFAKSNYFRRKRRREASVTIRSIFIGEVPQALPFIKISHVHQMP
jgi:hypothetical protein